MAGFQVILYGRFWVTPEAKLLPSTPLIVTDTLNAANPWAKRE